MLNIADDFGSSLLNGRTYLVVDAIISGHHSTYVREIIRMLSCAGAKVFFVTHAASSSNNFIDDLSKKFPEVVVIFLESDRIGVKFKGGAADVRREYAYWGFSRDAYVRVAKITKKINGVILPYIDSSAHAFSVLGFPFCGAPVYAVCMRQSFHHMEMGVEAPTSKGNYIKRMLFERLIKNKTLKVMFTIDETLHSYASRRSGREWWKLKLLKDPSDDMNLPDKHDTREMYSVSQDRRVLLVYGAIDERKGIYELLDAASSYERDQLPLILIAGKFSEEVRSKMLGPTYSRLILDGIVRIFDKYITEMEEAELFAISDAVWVGYRGHFSMSGVIVKAAMSGKYIVACQAGLIGWHARRMQNTLVIDIRSEAEVKRALCCRYSIGKHVDFQMMDHSWRNARALMLEALTGKV